MLNLKLGRVLLWQDKMLGGSFARFEKVIFQFVRCFQMARATSYFPKVVFSTIINFVNTNSIKIFIYGTYTY